MRSVSAVTALALLSAAALLCARAGAAEERPRVVLLAERADAEKIAVLASALEAQLSDFGAAVETRQVEHLSNELPQQVKIARAEAGGALSVVWLANAGGEFFIFVADRSSEKILVQSLPRSSEGWESACDAIATLVRSALRPWLTADPAAEAPPLRAEPPARPPLVPAPAPAPAPTAPSPKTPRVSAIRAVVTAGYAVALVDPGRGEVAHSAALGLGALLGAHLEIDLSLRAFSALPLDVPDADLRFVRLPIALSATGLMAFGRVSIGLGLGLVVDVTRVRGIPPSQEADGTAFTNVGIAPVVVARVRLVDWLAAYASVGADIFFRERRYRWDGETVLVYRRAQPGASIGLALLLPP
jgi:hypothetical protein